MTPIIFTDLDGSLLDHHTYSFAPATPMLEYLKRICVPVIANTSKTRAELLPLRKRIGNMDPFIVENGAAVYVSEEIARASAGCRKENGLYRKSFSRRRQYWIDLLKGLPPEIRRGFSGFHDMSAEEVADCTGLTTGQARLAMQREFSEPIRWHGPESGKARFMAAIRTLGATVLEGGRFIHIGDRTSKGKAMHWLTTWYSRSDPATTRVTVALGDSGNDVEMLEQADYPVLIKSPVHPFPDLQESTNLYRTSQSGPAGWVEGVAVQLERITTTYSGIHNG